VQDLGEHDEDAMGHQAKVNMSSAATRCATAGRLRAAAVRLSAGIAFASVGQRMKASVIAGMVSVEEAVKLCRTVQTDPIIHQTWPARLGGASFNLFIPFVALVAGAIVLGTVCLESIAHSQREQIARLTAVRDCYLLERHVLQERRKGVIRYAG
jgi:hypothetical protein